MQDFFSTLIQWQQAGKPIAIATVVNLSGTAPRPLGAKMGISAAGEMVGSVSGGCVEGAVVHEALEVLATGVPRLIEYGIADELAQSVGLACGGIIEILIVPLNVALLAAWQQADAERRALVTVHPLSGPQLGQTSVWSADGWHEACNLSTLDAALLPDATTALDQQRPQRVRNTSPQAATAEDFFMDVLMPPPRLIIVGAVHIAIHLVSLARTMGYYTLVLDARSAFATSERFSHADKVIVGWPADTLIDLKLDSATYLVSLTHDDKIDLPALAVALSSPARYVGALGSSRTLAARLEHLRDLGVDPALFSRLYAPIGLDLGGRQPEEIALAIMAEIVTVRHGRRLINPDRPQKHDQKHDQKQSHSRSSPTTQSVH